MRAGSEPSVGLYEGKVTILEGNRLLLIHKFPHYVRVDNITTKK